MLDPINLSAYADPVLDELVSGDPQIDGTIFFDIIRRTQGSILELGCGYGRLTIPLAQRDIINLTGLELSAPSLAYARTKAGDLPIRWVEADVRNFKLNKQYHLIFARGAVFGFMLTRTDQEAMLASVREHLDDNGQFMFDFYYRQPRHMVNVPEEVAWFDVSHPNGRQIFVSGTDHFDHAQQHHIQVCYERWDHPKGKLVRPPWELTLRYSTSQEVETLLHYNGFKIVSRYAGYDGTLETEEKPANVFICQKR
ncbi:MAG: class I SAM-dependent methyltransferase [Chloroflexi bacterium]|nr:class I SAM-dependent methyltransferase [Chloroflexota bacterium]